jgi:hypothetical protein
MWVVYVTNKNENKGKKKIIPSLAVKDLSKTTLMTRGCAGVACAAPCVEFPPLVAAAMAPWIMLSSCWRALDSALVSGLSPHDGWAAC